jgi:hypothetical protein
MTGVTSGAGTAYLSGATEFTPVFSEVRVTRSLVLFVCFVDRCLSLSFFFCRFCSLCCLFLFDLRILINHYGIFKLFQQSSPMQTKHA